MWVFKYMSLQMVLIIIHFKVTTYLQECLESKINDVAYMYSD